MRNRASVNPRLLLVSACVAASGLIFGACASTSEAPTEPVANQDDAGPAMKTVSIAIEPADLETVKAAGQNIAVVRKANGGSSEDRVLWATVEPQESTEFSWADGGPISLYVTETRAAPGEKVTMLAKTGVAPGQKFAYMADGTWDPRGEDASGGVLQLSLEPGTQATGAGVAAPYTVNGVASGTQPATWSPVEQGSSLELGLTNTVDVFLIDQDAIAGTIIGSEQGAPLTLDLEEQDRVEVAYDSDSGKFGSAD